MSDNSEKRQLIAFEELLASGADDDRVKMMLTSGVVPGGGWDHQGKWPLFMWSIYHNRHTLLDAFIANGADYITPPLIAEQPDRISLPNGITVHQYAPFDYLFWSVFWGSDISYLRAFISSTKPSTERLALLALLSVYHGTDHNSLLLCKYSGRNLLQFTTVQSLQDAARNRQLTDTLAYLDRLA